MAKLRSKVDKVPTVKSIKSQEMKWQAEDDMRTLVRAQEIQQDKGRMSRVRSVAIQQAKVAMKVAGKSSPSKRK